ncbi:MAG: hypothetical protein II811_02085, partial [Spirochaetaceae bacterium]|nr:hypothetical protein [Spirochaetaceae bacterium]
MKRVMMIAVFALLSAFAFAQTVGEKVYKEVSVNGEMVSKWLEVVSMAEYDSKGNEIYFKNSNGFERWSEYDSKGNKIHYKNSNGVEEWYEYDSKGNEIHFKNSDGDEWWYEYDSKGNEIHSKNSD